MNKVYNFSAGPAALPSTVLERLKSDLPEFRDAKASVMEISHRGVDFMALAKKAEQDLRDLMCIPDNYKVLFLQGGASQQFSMVPINLLKGKKIANYANTGHWSEKAIHEGLRYCHVNVCTDSTENGFTDIEDYSNWMIDPDGAYLHYTPNETIAGLEFDYIPEVDMPLVADMSSSILSRKIDVSKFGVIYAGAQKNIGVSGLTVVIVREDLMGKVIKQQPVLFDYTTQADKDSMYNTPCTFAWYSAALVFEWLKELGGIESISKHNKNKSQLLYKAIDQSNFYSNNVSIRFRSRMNVPFFTPNPELDKLFIQDSLNVNLLALKGHRAIGGIRASIYNSMSLEGVETLVSFMADFEKKYG
jgi:phosphoserine aminotransferase